MEIIEFESKNKDFQKYLNKIDQAKSKEEVATTFKDFVNKFYNQEYGEVDLMINKAKDDINLDEKEYLKFAMRVLLMPAEYGFSSIDAIPLSFKSTSFFDKSLIDTVSIYFGNLINEKKNVTVTLKEILIEFLNLQEDQFQDQNAAVFWIVERLKKLPQINTIEIEDELNNLALKMTEFNKEDIYQLFRLGMGVVELRTIEDGIKYFKDCYIPSEKGRIQLPSAIHNIRDELGYMAVKPDYEFTNKILENAQTRNIESPMSLKPLFAQIVQKTSN